MCLDKPLSSQPDCPHHQTLFELDRVDWSCFLWFIYAPHEASQIREDTCVALSSTSDKSMEKALLLQNIFYTVYLLKLLLGMHNISLPYGLSTNVRYFLAFTCIHWFWVFTCSFPLFLHLDQFLCHLNLTQTYLKSLLMLINKINLQQI